MSDRSSELATTLAAQATGDPDAAARLMPLVYDRLRRLAAKYVQGERDRHSLQPTALVHEAYLRLAEVDRIDWQGRMHFFAMAARTMRRILVERARAAAAQKRGNQLQRVTLGDELMPVPGTSIDVLTLDRALETMAVKTPRRARVAELRLFSGMQMDEIAHVIEVSEKTVRVEWKKARVSLARALDATGGTG